MDRSATRGPGRPTRKKNKSEMSQSKLTGPVTRGRLARVRRLAAYNFADGDVHFDNRTTLEDLDVPALLALVAGRVGLYPEQGRIVIRGEGDSYISTNVMPWHELHAHEIFHQCWEGTSYFGSDVKSVKVQICGDPPSGKACQSLADVPEYLKGRAQTVQLIFNNDDLCGQRALLLGMVDAQKRKNLLKKVPKRERQFTKEAQELAKKIGVLGAMTHADFDTFVAHPDHAHIQVLIFNCFQSCTYTTPNNEASTKLCIFHDEVHEHYHLIKDPDKFDCRRRFCFTCRKFHPRDSFGHHKCVGTRCQQCNERFDSPQGLEAHFAQTRRDEKREMVCTKCNHWAHSPECRDAHARICTGKKWFCLECYRNVDKERFQAGAHICGEEKCSTCGGSFPKEEGQPEGYPHRCFLQTPVPGKHKDDEFRCVAFDFECDIDTEDHHTVNAVAWRVVGEPACTTEYRRGPGALKQFVDYVLKQKFTTFVAHNGSGYDFLPVINHIVRATGKWPNPTKNGLRVMQFKIGSNKFIDSCNHIKAPLAGFPKCFGLRAGLRKGYYPYMRNTTANIGYIGPLPPKEAFLTKRLTREEFAKFDEWYASWPEGQMYDLEAETRAYCENDVDILAEGLAVYMKSGVATEGKNPLRKATIASWVQDCYLSNHMPADSLAVLYPEEAAICRKAFRGGRTQSHCPLFELTPAQIAAGWRIRGLDVCSLYPAVLFYDLMPCGAPTRVSASDCASVGDVGAWLQGKCGFACVDVECPDELLHPVLPEMGDRLNFTLEPKTRQWYTIVELQRALECDYRIHRLHDALLFGSSAGLFKGFIRTHLKGKIEASGALSQAEYLRLQQRCLAGYGIQLDGCSKNPAMRLISKLILNTLWGKFAQRWDLPKHEYMDPNAYFKLLGRHKKGHVTITDLFPVNDRLYVSFTDNSPKTNGAMHKTNLALAAYCTASARVRLHRALHALGNSMLYNDTDSVFFVQKPEAPCPIPIGDLLGEWTDEFAGEASDGGDLLCTGLVCAGPKAYGVRFANEGSAEKLKLKGVTLSHTNLESVDYNKLKELVENGVNGKRVQIAGLHGPAIKRRRVAETGGAVLVNADDAKDTTKNTKSISWTHTKTLPVSPEFAHMYLPHYLLPRGHKHAANQKA